MPHNSYPAGTPLGTVPSLYVVPSTDWKTIIDGVFQSLNGDLGGTWAPSAFVTVGGSGFNLTGTGHTVAASAVLNIVNSGTIKAVGAGSGDVGKIYLRVVSNVARLDVESGSVVAVKAGGALDIFGAGTVKTGGSLGVEASAAITVSSSGAITVNSGGTANLNGATNIRGEARVRSTANGGPGSVIFETGTTLTMQGTAAATIAGSLECGNSSTVELNGDTTFGNDNWPALSPARDWERPGRTPIPLTYNDGTATGPDAPDIWYEMSNLFEAPCYRTRPSESSGGLSIIEVTDLPIGGVITEATITTQGTTVSAVASTRPTYTIVSWLDSSAAGVSAHSSATTDVHSIPNFPLTQLQTTVTASGSPVVTAGRRYGIRINHPFQAGLAQGLRAFEVTLKGTLATLRS